VVSQHVVKLLAALPVYQGDNLPEFLFNGLAIEGSQLV
jgi:hypothetical protein